MSRKQRKRQRRTSLAWPLLVFGGILLLVAAFLLFTKSSVTSAAGGDGGGTPQIAVDPQKIDYGYVTFGNDKTFKIKVTNTGTGVLRFTDKPNVEVLEGC